MNGRTLKTWYNLNSLKQSLIHKFCSIGHECIMQLFENMLNFLGCPKHTKEGQFKWWKPLNQYAFLYQCKTKCFMNFAKIKSQKSKELIKFFKVWPIIRQNKSFLRHPVQLKLGSNNSSIYLWTNATHFSLWTFLNICLTRP